MPLFRRVFRAWDVSLEEFPAAGTPAEQARFLLRIAVLAPSELNTQPWRFRVDDHGVVHVFADRARQLSSIDPEGRFLLMSVGAAIKLLTLAGEYFDLDSTTRLFPEGRDSDLIATVEFNREGYTSPFARQLVPHATRRRTVEAEFAREFPADQIRLDLRTAIEFAEIAYEFIADLTARQHVGNLVADAERLLMDNPAYRRELGAWQRGNCGWHADGVPAWQLGLSGVSAMLAPWSLRFSGRAGAARAQAVRRQVMHSPVLVVVGTLADDIELMPAVGGALLHLHLTATQHHLSMGHLNAVVRVPELRQELRNNLFNDKVIPQAVVRLGYAPETPPSPRRPLRAVLAS